MDEPIWKEQTKAFIAEEELKSIRRNRGAHRAHRYFRRLAGMLPFNGTLRVPWSTEVRRLQSEARRIEDGFDLWLGEPEDVNVPDEYFRSMLPDVWEIDRCKGMEIMREPDDDEPVADRCPFCHEKLQPDASCTTCIGPPEPGEGVVYQPTPHDLQTFREQLVADELKRLADQPGQGRWANRETPYHRDREIERNLSKMRRWAEDAKLQHVRLMSRTLYNEETCEPLYWSRAAAGWVARDQGDVVHQNDVAQYAREITGPWEAVLYVPPDATFVKTRHSSRRSDYKVNTT